MPSRRAFLKDTGRLTIAFCLLGALPAAEALAADDPRPGSLQDNPRLNAWLEVLADGRVRVLTGKIEIGQGIGTAVAQMAAEELNLPLNRVEVVLAETGRTPDERYTAGSASIEQSALSVRWAAAAARQQLLQLAAKRLRVPAATLQLADGAVRTADGRQHLTFAELLAGRQLTGEVPADTVLKPKNQHQVVGQPLRREEIERMVRAAPVYVQDMRLPGTVHARVLHPPGPGARLRGVDEAGLRQAVPGLLRVVVDGSFVGLLAADEWTAIKAHDWLKPRLQWTAGPALPAGQALPEVIRALPAKVDEVARRGDVASAPATGEKSFRATYFKPYLMHASIGPSCAVALFDKGTLHLWTHSQGVYPLRAAVAKLLGLPEDQVHAKGVPGAGCYGHNGADDVAAEAALLARAYPGHPVRLQWTREDEHLHEPYGSAMLFDLQARLDARGRLTHWHMELWSDTHSARPAGQPDKLLPAQLLAKPFEYKRAELSGGTSRNSEPLYQIPNMLINAHSFAGPLRVSALRSLGAFGNVFALESGMDELAQLAGQDPWAFRLAHLTDERARAVIEEARRLTQNVQAGPNEGLGMAFAQYKNQAAYLAVVARVWVSPEDHTPWVRQLWAAIDAGEVINPDGLRNQTEGGLIQAASWTVLEQVQFDQQQVRSHDWESYPIYRFDEVPRVEVSIVSRPDQPPLGAGEAAQGPTAAAIANAVHRACGVRVRELPIRPWKLAPSSAES
ncbi:xanthine dehydrogenase family protein molybdopterin-binding subunit [Hymenobacter jeollabukensis]|uniref:Xanthine dehydrogenase family protein molybdopterin-binding subunit n=1 Tax=Hymenobacter jeollabukensis TaxID=2025313 RepID=A0A5R8WQ94_9BACT|nr:molybdopterin cofactor-binding domain-containing protein [Hymenobacter jeollabukensis]TLM91902.1 xanthine dehydrogenase family protein molybdopterin-binding subunit [Hymenobacter jeollabukensis]